MKLYYVEFTRFPVGITADFSWEGGNMAGIYLGCNKYGPILVDKRFLPPDTEPIALDLEAMGYPKISVLSTHRILSAGERASLLTRLQE